MFNAIGGVIAIGPYKVLAEHDALEYSPMAYNRANVGPADLIIVDVVNIYNRKELGYLATVLGIDKDNISQHRITKSDNLPEPDKLVLGEGWIGTAPIPYLSRLFHELLDEGCTLWFVGN